MSETEHKEGIITRDDAIKKAGGTHWWFPAMGKIRKTDAIIPCAERLGESKGSISGEGSMPFEDIDSGIEHIDYVRNYLWKSELQTRIDAKMREWKTTLQTMRKRVFDINPPPNDEVVVIHKLPPFMKAPIHFDVGQKVFLLEQQEIDKEILVKERKILSVRVECDFGVMGKDGWGQHVYMAKPGVEFSKVDVNSLRLKFRYSVNLDEFPTFNGARVFDFNKYDEPGQEETSSLDSASDHVNLGSGVRVFFTIAAIEDYLNQADGKYAIAQDRIHDAQINIIPELKEGLHNTHP
ncbi:MAG TPA: hypothetical protein DEA55_02305 [Rhodospirillaceae bacterium]|nr:hypothetical protein [Rhodospirillaceae bacterium]